MTSRRRLFRFALAAGAMPVAAVPATAGRAAPVADPELGRTLKGFGVLTFRDDGRELTVEGLAYARQLDTSWFVALDPTMRRRLDAFAADRTDPGPLPTAWPRSLDGGDGIGGDAFLCAFLPDGSAPVTGGFALDRSPAGGWILTDTTEGIADGERFHLPAGATADDALAFLFGSVEAISARRRTVPAAAPTLEIAPD